MAKPFPFRFLSFWFCFAFCSIYYFGLNLSQYVWNLFWSASSSHFRILLLIKFAMLFQRYTMLVYTILKWPGCFEIARFSVIGLLLLNAVDGQYVAMMIYDTRSSYYRAGLRYGQGSTQYERWRLLNMKKKKIFVQWTGRKIIWKIDEIKDCQGLCFVSIL